MRPGFYKVACFAFSLQPENVCKVRPRLIETTVGKLAFSIGHVKLNLSAIWRLNQWSRLRGFFYHFSLATLV